jgi:hypothetical protein
MIVRVVGYNEFVNVPRFGSADDDDIAAKKQMLAAFSLSSNGDSLYESSTGAAAIDNKEPVVAPFNLKVLARDIQRLLRFNQV